MKTISIALLSSVFLTVNAHAIVIRHDVKPENYLVQPAKYPSVIDLDFLTGTLISPQWILTAAHGTDYMPAMQTLKIGQQTYRVTHIVEHPDYNKDNLNHDIALLKLDRPVTEISPTPIYTEEDEKHKHVWFVGRGDTGNGITGITQNDKVLRHAENTIEDAAGLWLTFDFDSVKTGALALEGISGPGDSGGPAFVSTPSGYKVAGVSSHQRNNDNGEGLYGVMEYYARTSSHQQWILDTQNKDDAELKKVALDRPYYPAQASSSEEKESLLGRYKLNEGAELLIEYCKTTLCYRWANSNSQTEIQKAKDNLWFVPSLNRVFKFKFGENSEFDHLEMVDFNGTRKLIRQEQASALKQRIKQRGRTLLNHVEPAWPQRALDEKLEGSVTMSFSINTDGSVYDIKILESSSDGLFDDVSIKALAQWKYAKLDNPVYGVKTKFDFAL